MSADRCEAPNRARTLANPRRWPANKSRRTKENSPIPLVAEIKRFRCPRRAEFGRNTGRAHVRSGLVDPRGGVIRLGNYTKYLIYTR